LTAVSVKAIQERGGAHRHGQRNEGLLAGKLSA
jgi:hypothetical protein